MELVVGSNVEMVWENGTGWDEMKQREEEKPQNPKRHF